MQQAVGVIPLWFFNMVILITSLFFRFVLGGRFGLHQGVNAVARGRRFVGGRRPDCRRSPWAFAGAPWGTVLISPISKMSMRLHENAGSVPKGLKRQVRLPRLSPEVPGSRSQVQLPLIGGVVGPRTSPSPAVAETRVRYLNAAAL